MCWPCGQTRSYSIRNCGGFSWQLHRDGRRRHQYLDTQTHHKIATLAINWLTKYIFLATCGEHALYCSVPVGPGCGGPLPLIAQPGKPRRCSSAHNLTIEISNCLQRMNKKEFEIQIGQHEETLQTTWWLAHWVINSHVTQEHNYHAKTEKNNRLAKNINSQLWVTCKTIDFSIACINYMPYIKFIYIALKNDVSNCRCKVNLRWDKTHLSINKYWPLHFYRPTAHTWQVSLHMFLKSANHIVWNEHHSTSAICDGAGKTRMQLECEAWV